MVGFGRGGSGDLPKTSLTSRSPSIDPLSLYVWRTSENRCQRFFCKGTLRQDNTSPRRLQRIHHHRFGNRLGIFSGAANQITPVLRNLDVGGTLFFIGLAAF